MGPRQTLAPASPCPGGGINGVRPTDELLGTMFRTPELEAIIQRFANLQNYESTLEDVAVASPDVNFKEDLSTIKQWFKVFSEGDRTAALYSLLQHSILQVQTLQHFNGWRESDPMTAMLSPAVGGWMQDQIEAKLAQTSLKSPALKSPMPSSTRNFSGSQNRQSLALDTSSAFLPPDSALNSGGHDTAATLAQQRAKLKETNGAHRISTPVLASSGADGRTTWGSALGQVVEQNPQSPAQAIAPPSPGLRPKCTMFSSFLLPHPGADTLAPVVGDSWAAKLTEWSGMAPPS